MGVSALPNGLRQILAAEVQELLAEADETGGNKWSLKRLAKEFGCSGEAVRDARDGSGGPKVLDGVLKMRGVDLAHLLQKYPQHVDTLTAVVAGARGGGALTVAEPPGPPYGDARYPARERAIRALVMLGRDEAAVREAADEVAVALDSDTDLDPEWWAERIKLEMTARKRPGPRLGQVEITEEDDEFIVTEGASPEQVEAAKRLFPKVREDRRHHGGTSDQPPGPHKKARTSKGA